MSKQIDEKSQLFIKKWLKTYIFLRNMLKDTRVTHHANASSQFTLRQQQFTTEGQFMRPTGAIHATNGSNSRAVTRNSRCVSNNSRPKVNSRPYSPSPGRGKVSRSDGGGWKAYKVVKIIYSHPHQALRASFSHRVKPSMRRKTQFTLRQQQFTTAGQFTRRKTQFTLRQQQFMTEGQFTTLSAFTW